MPSTQYFEHTLKLSPRSSPAGLEFPAKLAYWSLGDSKKPTILMPTCFAGTLATTSPYLYNSEKAALPLSEYHILIVGLLGGGESSSPSNTGAPFSGPDFPHVTYEDNIRLQHALCTKHLGIDKLAAYIGFSMGGQQAYHISVLYPGFVERIVALATSARTSWHNWSFLEGPKAALTSSVDFKDGKYDALPLIGLRAFGRVYSTWALSQPWFRQESWKLLGYDTLEGYLQENWSEKGDANDLLCMLWTWQCGDVSVHFPEDKGDLAKTLGRVEAKCLIMPSRTDQYFPPEDNEEEVKHLRYARLAVIESVWGHLAGGGAGTKEDKDFVSEQVREFVRK